MEERSKIHVGLDVHKDSISVAAAEPNRAPGRSIGKVPHDVPKPLKLLAKVGTAEQLHIVYEAGPTGFGLQRSLKAKGYSCEIIAPSQIPRGPGDRIKIRSYVGHRSHSRSKSGVHGLARQRRSTDM